VGSNPILPYLDWILHPGGRLPPDNSLAPSILGLFVGMPSTAALWIQILLRIGMPGKDGEGAVELLCEHGPSQFV
jgi:hypothetical protein